MKASTHRPGRPLDVNAVDHRIRCLGGETVALDMEPIQMQRSKRAESPKQHIEFLSRKVGQLRLEVDFYRRCYRLNKMKDENTAQSYKRLMQQYITFLCADPSMLGDVRDLLGLMSTTISSILDENERSKTMQNAALQELLATLPDHTCLQTIFETNDGMF